MIVSRDVLAVTLRGARLLAATIAVAGLTAHSAAAQQASRVVVYTNREKPLIDPVLQVFQSLTRVAVETVYLAPDAPDRLATDAAAGKVDLLVATGAIQLAEAKAKGLTASPGKSSLTEALRPELRDPEGHWYALTVNLRVVVAARERVTQKSFTYEDLADPRWKGKVCIRSGLHPYNLGLVASLVAHKGAPAAESWLRGLKANLSAPPAGGDRDQILAVAGGKCDVALVNSYYIGVLRADSGKPDNQIAGNAVTIHFPNAGDRGANVGISGMALMKNAPNRDAAVLLMDFLLSEPTQFVYAQDNHEYPARTGVDPSGLVDSWGTPKLDALPLHKVIENIPHARDLVRKVEVDKGPVD